MKPFINSYNWEGTDYPSNTEGWKRFEKSNEAIVFNVFYIKKEIKHIQLIFQKLI